MKTPMQQLFLEIRKYKSPTNLNGTDYIMLPINKIDYLEINFLEDEKNVLGLAFRDGMEVYAGKPVETELDFEEFYNETFKKDGNN
jgi:hypothetical protein